MHTLGLEVANVSGRDLALGPQALHAYADSLGVQLVSANVQLGGKLLLPPYVVLRRRVGGRDLRIGITAVTAKMPAGWGDSLRLAVTDPVQAARQILPDLEAHSDLQVLLAYLPAAEVDTLAKELKGYDVLVSGYGDARATPRAGASTPVVLAPGTKAKQLAWVLLKPGPETSRVASGKTVGLDLKVRDDPETAKLVAGYKARFKTPAHPEVATPRPESALAPGTRADSRPDPPGVLHVP